MSKCIDCRKNEAMDTRWEKIRRWFFIHLFPEDIYNITQEKYTMGFGDGYKEGGKNSPQMSAEELLGLFDKTGEEVLSADETYTGHHEIKD